LRRLLRRRFLRPGRNDLGPAGRWRGLGLGKRRSLWRRLRIDPIRRGFDGWASHDILLGDCALVIVAGGRAGHRDLYEAIDRHVSRPIQTARSDWPLQPKDSYACFAVDPAVMVTGQRCATVVCGRRSARGNLARSSPIEVGSVQPCTPLV